MCQGKENLQPKACKNYLQSASDKNAFTANEYLSKALLEYMFSLAFLPGIYDIGY